MEKLTEMDVLTIGHPETAKRLWDRILDDREITRQEARAEVLKDHFKIGEILEVETRPEEWAKAVVEVRGPGGNLVYGKWRRPVKMVPMDENQIRELFAREEVSAWYYRDKLKLETIKDILEAHGIPTEVPE